MLRVHQRREGPLKLSVDLTVADVERSAEFYRKLGVELPEVWKKDGVAHHVEVQAGFMLNSRQLTGSYDASVPGVVLIFEVPDRGTVDERFAELVEAGYTAHHEPFDAFWGSRYAIVDDPDGNHVGIMGPQDMEHKAAPGL